MSEHLNALKHRGKGLVAQVGHYWQPQHDAG